MCNDSIYKLYLKSGEWKRFNKLEVERFHYQPVAVESKMHLLGGFNRTSLTCTETFSRQTLNLCDNVPAMHGERNKFAVCSVAGLTFATGGVRDKVEFSKQCEVYSSERRSWTRVASMNAERSAFSMIYFQRKLWAIGGLSNGGCLDSIETYD